MVGEAIALATTRRLNAWLRYIRAVDANGLVTAAGVVSIHQNKLALKFKVPVREGDGVTWIT